MAKSAFQTQLGSLNKTWAGAKEKQDQMFGGQMLPAGVYTAQLINAKLILTKQSQKLAIARNFLIVEGDFEGKNISDMMGLNFNELSPVFARRWIEQMGYAAPEDLAADLENVLDAITKDAQYCKIKVKQSGTYYNIDVLEAWASDADAEGESEPAEVEDEVEAEEADEAPAPVADDADTLAALMEFASSQDLGDTEVSDEDTIESLKEKLSVFQWSPEELADGEPELLESVGLGGNIIRPAAKAAPKAAPKAKAAPAAPARPSAPAAKAAPAKAPAKAAPKKR